MCLVVAGCLFVAVGRGKYFSNIVADPDRYLHRRDGLREWLAKERADGMRFFLVTNSHVGYGGFLLRHVFG